MCEFCDDIKSMPTLSQRGFHLKKVFYLKPERHIEIHLFKGIEDITKVNYCPSCGGKLKTGD